MCSLQVLKEKYSTWHWILTKNKGWIRKHWNNSLPERNEQKNKWRLKILVYNHWKKGETKKWRTKIYEIHDEGKKAEVDEKIVWEHNINESNLN